MATPRNIPKDEWRTFFDAMSKHFLTGKRAEVEVASLDLGDQQLGQWLPLLGITYDSHDDLLDVAMVGIDHLIYHPSELTVYEGSKGIESIGVLAGDGTKQVITLKEPLQLPAAGTRA